MLEHTPDLHTFLQSAEDRYYRAERFLAWRCAPELIGVDLWGSYSRDSFEERARILDHFTADSGRRQNVLVDNSIGFDANLDMYAAAADFWSSRRARHRVTINKLALVIPSGFVGALITGLSVLVDTGCPVQTFGELEPALHWLGHKNSSALRAELRELRPSTGHEALLERLRRLLEESQCVIGLRDTARHLAMSERTLQRHLSFAHTTFQRELSRAKLAKAMKLMLSGQHNLTAIAFELGFASPQHFSARFSAFYGQSPSHWLRNCRDVQKEMRLDKPCSR